MTHLQLTGDFQEHSWREDYLLIYGKFSETHFLGQGAAACMISIKGLTKAVDFICFERLFYSFIFLLIFSSIPGFTSGLTQLLAV